MMNLQKPFLDQVVDRVLSVAKPERILLFGSAASGTTNPDSDVDILVLEADPPDTRKQSIAIRRSLRGLRRAFDVIVMRTQRFEETKNVVGGISYPANRYGKVIYDVKGPRE